MGNLICFEYFDDQVLIKPSFGAFTKILCKWKGSIYKLVYKEMLAYILAYFVINLT